MTNPVARATDCSFLKEGEIFRLDQKGKSLENFKAQDQDGLGTCYANAASVILQSKLPGHPEVSYLDLAINYKIDGINNQKLKLSQNSSVNIYTKEKKSKLVPIVDDGGSCLTIKKVIEHQKSLGHAVLCPRNALNIENKYSSGDYNWAQFENILNASLYMNQFQSTFNLSSIENKQKYLAFKNSLTKLINDQQEEFKKSECNKISPVGNDVFLNLFIKMIEKDESCVGNYPVSTPVCKAVSTLVDSLIITDNGAVDFKNYSKDFLNDLNVNIFKTSDSVEIDELKSQLIDSFKNIAKLNKEEVQEIGLIVDKIPLHIFQKQLDVINDIKKNGFSKACAEQKTLKYLSSDRFKYNWKKEVNLCLNSKLMEDLSRLVSQYRQADLEGFDNIINFILENAALNYDEAIKALYAADCGDNDKILIPEDLSCEQYKLDYANNIDKEKVNQVIFDSLKNDTPTIGYLCSNIFDGPVTSQILNEECNDHVVAIIGMKCIDGKNQFLIQNSWGSNFIPKNKALIPEVGKGSVWFDEKSFGDVFYSFEVFK